MNLLYALTVPWGSENLGGAFSPERWSYAGRMTLLGMVMVFSVLGILWGILHLFKLVMLKSTSKPKTKRMTVEKKTVSVPERRVADAVVDVAVSDDEELIAVLTAAIAAYRAQENQNGDVPSDFRVVSFRRETNVGAWNARR